MMLKLSGRTVTILNIHEDYWFKMPACVWVTVRTEFFLPLSLLSFDGCLAVWLSLFQPAEHTSRQPEEQQHHHNILKTWFFLICCNNDVTFVLSNYIHAWIKESAKSPESYTLTAIYSRYASRGIWFCYKNCDKLLTCCLSVVRFPLNLFLLHLLSLLPPLLLCLPPSYCLLLLHSVSSQILSLFDFLKGWKKKMNFLNCSSLCASILLSAPLYHCFLESCHPLVGAACCWRSGQCWGCAAAAHWSDTPCCPSVLHPYWLLGL